MDPILSDAVPFCSYKLGRALACRHTSNNDSVWLKKLQSSAVFVDVVIRPKGGKKR